MRVAVIMTIHQPSALVFGMFDDLLLLEGGRMVYAGRVSDAEVYFQSLGFNNPHNINPADYYLDLVQRTSLEVDWRREFSNSVDGTAFKEEVLRLIDKQGADVSVLHPSFISKLRILMNHFALYFLRERAAYINRFLSLIAIGVFGGTFFLNLQPTTFNIRTYTGALFFASFASMFIGIAPTALFANDRSEAVERVKNGIHSPGVFVLAQCLVSSLYNIPLSFVFTSLFYWLSNVDTTIECYFYFVVMNWSLIGISESALLVVVEFVKNDFLSVSAGIVFIGSCLMLAGFNRPVSVIPVWCSWLCYIVPLKVTYSMSLLKFLINVTSTDLMA